MPRMAPKRHGHSSRIGSALLRPEQVAFWLCVILVVVSVLGGLITSSAIIFSSGWVSKGLAAPANRSLCVCLQSLPLKYHDARRSSDSSFRVAYDSQSIQTIYNKRFRHHPQLNRHADLDLWDHGLDELAVGIDFAGGPSICHLGDRLFCGPRSPAVTRPSKSAKATCSH